MKPTYNCSGEGNSKDYYTPILRIAARTATYMRQNTRALYPLETTWIGIPLLQLFSQLRLNDPDLLQILWGLHLIINIMPERVSPILDFLPIEFVDSRPEGPP